jgi:hypothetical protein
MGRQIERRVSGLRYKWLQASGIFQRMDGAYVMDPDLKQAIITPPLDDRSFSNQVPDLAVRPICPFQNVFCFDLGSDIVTVSAAKSVG